MDKTHLLEKPKKNFETLSVFKLYMINNTKLLSNLIFSLSNNCVTIVLTALLTSLYIHLFV